MLPQELIRRKREGERLAEDDIRDFVRGVADGSVTEGQVAAFCMAVYFRPLTIGERVALTGAMTRSGQVMDWPSLGIDQPVVDKHSTGGVGDKVSLLLAPIIAAAGGLVPMISGRGLGHTGGTLDKLEAIPGYRIFVSPEDMAEQVRRIGCAVVGATGDLAPADKRMYAIRDTTGTVESLDLITASILAKKLAAGLTGLVMDVKFGSGAFLADPEASRALAQSIVDVATGAGTKTVALQTDMNQCLGRTAGNAVEVRESIDALVDPGRAEPRLMAVTRELCAEMLTIIDLQPDLEAARAKVDQVLADGSAAGKFQEMVVAQGGPADIIGNPDMHLPPPPVQIDVHAERDGVISEIDTRALGLAVVELGGGRVAPTDAVDPLVGLTDIAGLGEATSRTGRPLARILARSPEDAAAAAVTVRRAFTLGEDADIGPLILRRVTAGPA